MKVSRADRTNRRYMSKRDIIIVVILVLVNIFIIGYGKVRDNKLTKELKQLYSTSEDKSNVATEQVTEEKGILAKEIVNKDFVFPRNLALDKALKEEKFKGLILGDSIAQGIGSTGNINILSEEIGSGLLKEINLLSKEGLTPENLAVGGSTIETILSYISDTTDGKSKAFQYPYWVFITGRNEMDTMTPQQFKVIYKIAVAIGEKNGIEVICCSEPPEINMNNGNIVDSKYMDYKKAIEEVAKEEGATYIDVYSSIVKKKEAGENISRLSFNGVLPNDEGYKLFSSLITEGIVSKSIEFQKSEGSGGAKLITVYNPVETVNKVKVENLLSKSTSKRFNTENSEVITLEPGINSTFKIPEGKVQGIVITLIGGTNGGNLRITTDTNSLDKSIKINNTQVKEGSAYISFENVEDLNNIKDIIVSTNKEVNLSGITFIMK